ncbi:MAG TPA: acyltransferase, partial [Hyphomicrobiales bacterium]|nr:acyltransferase [Hyphomicrobiales bacterium]
MRYRAEIDGLRAIAVLAVLVYHAQFVVAGHTLLPGGFLGVDVFFVISGYLISSILLAALDAGTFSFADFYARRARRILPMLFLVVICTLPAAVALMGLQALREYFLSAVAALWFSANFVFWLQDGYYAEPSELKPLLHTWSLAIEEQFYLLFPLLLLLAHRYCRRHLWRLTLALAVASLLLANYGSRHFADATFYLLPTRAWELLCGVLLALWEREARTAAPTVPSVFSARVAGVLAALGLVLVALSFAVFTSHARHPSVWTVLPVAGSMLLIRYGGGGHVVARLLQRPGLVFVGLVSYGLYLWHFPLLVFARHVVETPPPLLNAALLVAAFGLAVLSYHWCEKPLRFSRKL